MAIFLNYKNGFNRKLAILFAQKNYFKRKNDLFLYFFIELSIYYKLSSMKNVAYAAIFLFLGLSLPTVKAQVSTTTAPKPQITRAIILVPSLQTQNEATALKADLKATQGITYSEVELQNKKVIVAFDAAIINVGQISSFIETKGYKAEVMYPRQNTVTNTGKQ